MNAEGDGTLHSFKALVRNAPAVRARDIIAGENKICPFERLEWLKIQSFQELE